MGSYDRVKKLLNDNRDKLDLLAKTLEEEEVLDGDQVLELLHIEKKHHRNFKEAEIAPIEQLQQNLQFLQKDCGKS